MGRRGRDSPGGAKRSRSSGASGRSSWTSSLPRETHEIHGLPHRIVVPVRGLDEAVDVVNLLEQGRVFRLLDGQERGLEPLAHRRIEPGAGADSRLRNRGGLGPVADLFRRRLALEMDQISYVAE